MSDSLNLPYATLVHNQRILKDMIEDVETRLHYLEQEKRLTEKQLSALREEEVKANQLVENHPDFISF